MQVSEVMVKVTAISSVPAGDAPRRRDAPSSRESIRTGSRSSYDAEQVQREHDEQRGDRQVDPGAGGKAVEPGGAGDGRERDCPAA